MSATAGNTSASSSINSIFEAADANHDGRISLQEMTRIFRRLGDWSDSEFEIMFKAADLNKDRSLCYHEFVKWVMGDVDQVVSEMTTLDKIAVAVDGLRRRQELLCEAALHAPRPVDEIWLDPLSNVPTCDDPELEQLWERVEAFESSLKVAAAHFQLVLATSGRCDGHLDANSLEFPRLQSALPADRWVQFGDVPARRTEAKNRKHKEQEVALWGRNLDVVPFEFPGSIQTETEGVDVDESEVHWRSCLARSPEQLRVMLYGGSSSEKAWDMTVDGEAAWRTLPEGVIPDDCLSEDAPQEGASFYKMEMLHARRKTKGLVTTWEAMGLPAGFVVPSPPLLEKDAAMAALQERRVLEKENEDYVRMVRETEGSQCTCWPRERRWPPQGSRWNRQCSSIRRRAGVWEAAARTKQLQMHKRRFFPELLSAVRSGDLDTIASLLDGGVPPCGIAKPMLLFHHACALQVGGNLVCPKLTEMPVDGNLEVSFLNGETARFTVSGDATVAYVRDLVAATIAHVSERRWIQLLSGEDVLVDPMPVATLRGPPWEFTGMIRDLGSATAFRAFRMLLAKSGVPPTEALALLRTAAARGNAILVPELLAQGASPNEALSFLCEEFDVWPRASESLRFVLEAGADPFHNGTLEDSVQQASDGLESAFELCCTLLSSSTTRANVERALTSFPYAWHMVSTANPQVCSDEVFMRARVAEDGLLLRFASASLQGDRRIVEIAARQNAHAFQFASPNLLTSMDFVEECCRTNWRVLSVVPHEMLRGNVVSALVELLRGMCASSETRIGSDLEEVLRILGHCSVDLQEVKAIVRPVRTLRLSSLREERDSAQRAIVNAHERVVEMETAAVNRCSSAEMEMQNALDAVNCLTLASLVELKAMRQPPMRVLIVFEAVHWLLRGRRARAPKDELWRTLVTSLCKPVSNLLVEATKFDSSQLSEKTFWAVRRMTRESELTPERVHRCSMAAGVLIVWVLAVLRLHEIRTKSAQACHALKGAINAETTAKEKLTSIDLKISQVERGCDFAGHENRDNV